MSKRDDEIAAMFGGLPSKRRRPTSRALIIPPKYPHDGESCSALFGTAKGGMSAATSISISASGTLTMAGQMPTVTVEPGEQELDWLSTSCDRWLKLVLPRRFYRKVVEQLIADWQHEVHATDAPAWWITTKNFGYLAWVMAKWPFMAVLVNWILSNNDRVS